MAKITLTDLTNLQNETTVVSKINLNNSLIETAIENTLSRDGSSPNMMGANLDMNSNRILNLPAPSANTEPVRLYDLDLAVKDIVDFQDTLTEKVSEASDYAAQAEESAISAYSSYILASNYADSLTAVSMSSNAIENGSKMFSIQTGKQFKNGQYVLISYTQDVTKYLYGYVTDYTGSSLTVQVVATQGSGTYADWTIGLSAIRGPQGEVGPKGDTGAQGPQGLQGPTGNTGPSAWAAPVAWQTGQSYTATAPASVVTQGGETYVCIVSHLSGTFSVDLAAAKWLKIAAKGADGSGTGDMLKADNLSGLANVATARTNLGATTVGSALFTAANAAAARTNLGATTVGNALFTAADAAAARSVIGAESSGGGRGLFYKTDYKTVAFTRTGNGTISLKAGTVIELAGVIYQFSTDTAVQMPTLTAGTDYAIYLCNDGTLRADASFTAATGFSISTCRQIGGFHYAPGGNATAQAGGDATPQINPYSLWDVKFRPACTDPRGMTLVAGSFWCDIYLTGVDHHLNGTSKYNVTIADGPSPPKIPLSFGGNGTSTYSTFTWWEASEVMQDHGKDLLSYGEFAAAAFGSTEGSTSGADPGSTILRQAYTSKWGVMLATGNLWVWGRDASYWPGENGVGWRNQTGGRGQLYLANDSGVVYAIFGGDWGATAANCGSRTSYWSYLPFNSSNAVGARGRCDHMRHV